MNLQKTLYKLIAKLFPIVIIERAFYNMYSSCGYFWLYLEMPSFSALYEYLNSQYICLATNLFRTLCLNFANIYGFAIKTDALFTLVMPF